MLLRGGCVLSLDKQVGNLRDADVLIEDGHVAEVGTGLRARGVEVVDATDTIVMPGFVDTHRHAWKTLLKNLGGGDAANVAERLGRHYRPDDVYAATLLGLCGAARVGITTVVDWSDIPLDAAYTEAALQAHADAGVRTVFVHAAPAWPGAPTDDGTALRRLVADGADLVGPLTTLAWGAPSPSSADIEADARRWTQARELGLRIHTHTGTRLADRGVVAELGARGLLGDDVTLVHGTHLGDDDLEAAASHQAAVALTPASEMASGVGAAPVQRLIDRGIRPGLGVDDELLTPGDLFAQMHTTQSLQHAGVFELKLAGKAGVPALLGTRDVIRYATVDGARVAGLAGVTGALAPGMQADLVLLRTDRPNIAPVNDPIGAVVWGMDASNVDSVFVGGRPLVRGGEPAADLPRLRDLAAVARDHILAAGALVETVDGGPR